MSTFERCSLQRWFTSPLFILLGQPILFSPSPAFPLREVHQKSPDAIVFPFFYSHSYIYLAPLLCLPNVGIFKRATLCKMVNRCGTSSTHARLSRAKVIPSYVSWPDVLLTAIDFHLFIFSLRIWSPPPPLYFKPQNSNLATVRDIALLKFKIWSDCLFFLGFLFLCTFCHPATCAVTPAPTAAANSHNLKATDSTYCLMLPHILSVWIGISFEQFHSDKSL